MQKMGNQVIRDALEHEESKSDVQLGIDPDMLWDDNMIEVYADFVQKVRNTKDYS